MRGGPSELHRGGARVGRTRRLLLQRDGPGCGRCHQPINMALPGTHTDGPTVGHVQAATRGGGDELANLRLEHRRCNLAAGNRRTPPAARIVAPPD